MKFLKDYIKTERVQQAIREVGAKYPDKTRIRIDFQDLERFDRTLADEVRAKPNYKMSEYADEITPLIITSDEKPRIEVGFTNIPKEYSPPSIDGICERHIGTLMRVEGMVGQISEKYPYMTQSYYLCNRCDTPNIIPQINTPKSIITEPSICVGCGKRDSRFFKLIPDLSTWSVAQVMVLVEKPEMLRAGQKPPSLTVHLTGDLSRESFDLMDKLVVDGVLEVVPHSTHSKDRKFIWYLKASNMETLERGFDEIEITPKEEEEIKKLSQNPKLLEEISNSIAPSIYGHNELKKALVLQLLGGTEKEQYDAKRRYWINILAMSDPGTGRSVLSNALCNIAPKAIYTTGSGSKVGGLTTTAEKDSLTGEWMIKPGILPMASDGLVALDEIGTLGEDEMNSLREAMEQGSVSSAKAGKSVRFMSKTAIFACGNPKSGRFDDYTNPITQFGIPSPILSRFDLMFVVRDVKDTESDRQIAKAIFKAHTNQIVKPTIDRELIRKYIAYAKQKHHPMLDTKDPRVEEELGNFYTTMRNAGFDSGVVSATARQYEALVRLAEASAKLRLSDVAGLNDVKIAEEIVTASNNQLASAESGGVLDIDVITTGKPKGEREKLRLVEVNIGEISRNNPDGCCGKEELQDAIGGDVPEDKLEKYLQHLLNTGRVHEPRYGRYRLVGE